MYMTKYQLTYRGYTISFNHKGFRIDKKNRHYYGNLFNSIMDCVRFIDNLE